MFLQKLEDLWYDFRYYIWRTWFYLFSKRAIKVGEVYWDCAYHPVLCTESDGEDVAGISLFDGSGPRSCSIYNCGATKLNSDQVQFLIKKREMVLEAERKFHDSETFNANSYEAFRIEVFDSGLFGWIKYKDGKPEKKNN